MTMPRDDALDSESDEINVADQEVEEFQQFCLMVKPLNNCPKVHLHGYNWTLERQIHS